MSRKKGSKLKLGVFVSIGTFLFILGIYMVGRHKNMFGSSFELSCVTNNASGLMPGSNVRFSGINVGTVENIVIVRDTVVRIDMVIESDIRQFIKKDSKAVIGSEGLMGNKIVNILPGSAPSKIVDDNDIILSSAPIDFDEVLKSLQKTGKNVEYITTDLAIVLHNVSHGKGTVGKMLVDSSFAETLEQSMLNIQRGTQGFSDNMEALKGNFLFKGYYKKKEKERQEKEEEQENKDKKKKDRKKGDDK